MERISKDWRDLIDSDYPDPGHVMKKDLKEIIRIAKRFRGSVRTMMGQIMSYNEYEKTNRYLLKRFNPKKR
ncbi:MAG TPA: hypothetical protein PLQ76_01870 [bacterium]|nr:hypothetical protein [bacterium]